MSRTRTTDTGGRKHALGKFYTKPAVALACLDRLDLNSFDRVIEPSAGSGAFSDHLFTSRSRALRDAGVLLLDVLLGITLASLVLVTASQTTGTLRGIAHETRTSADAHQLALTLPGQAQNLTAASFRPPALTTTLTGLGANMTKGNRVAGYGLTATNKPLVCVEHLTSGVPDAYAFYDGARARVVVSGRGVGCPAAPPTASSPAASWAKVY